jgi:hypothetical protein
MMRHGVTTVLSGARMILGIIFTTLGMPGRVRWSEGLVGRMGRVGQVGLVGQTDGSTRMSVDR